MIHSHVSLLHKNTLGIDSFAEFFAEIKTLEDLYEAQAFQAQKNIPLRLLGLGSNVLLPTGILPGLTLKISYQNCTFTNHGTVILGAGNILSSVVSLLAQKNYDWSALSGYPSTMGGCVRGNTGTTTTSIADFLIQGTLINLQTQEKFVWKKEDFEFTYRNSKLKKNPHLLFWEGEFSLPQGENVTEKIISLTQNRKEKQPSGKSLGSFFKNPTDEVNNPQKFSAGYFIDQCGLKGLRVGDAEISEKHANFFMNIGHATSEDFVKLIHTAQEAVHKKFGIRLELEIEIVT